MQNIFFSIFLNNSNFLEFLLIIYNDSNFSMLDFKFTSIHINERIVKKVLIECTSIHWRPH
jgi:hypothetical protein